MPSNSFLDQIKAFGARLGLPKVDVDKLVEMNRKNFEALMRSASVAGEGAKALAEKQREIVQVALNETSAMVKDFHPTGSPQEIVAKQSEYARKAFEVAIQNTRDLAELATKTTAEAAGIVRERIQDNLRVLRESVGLAPGAKTQAREESETSQFQPPLGRAVWSTKEALIGFRVLQRSLRNGTNVPLYPKFQAFFRERKPPTLIVWGKNDKIFPPTAQRLTCGTCQTLNSTSSIPATSRLKTSSTRWRR